MEEMLLASLEPAVKPEPEVEWDGFVEMTRTSLEPRVSGKSSSIDWSAIEAFIDAMEEIHLMPPPQVEPGDDPLWPGTKAALCKSIEDVVIVID